ncbi:MAG: glycosyltransferase family 8 protein [Patescibacteria group bacterium]|nr:glycosyltransferase family 8 protein [Patescibacteria group bacterium]
MLKINSKLKIRANNNYKNLINHQGKGGVINIVFSSDDNYAPLLGIALCSLFENKKVDRRIKIFIIDSDISSKNKGYLKILANKYNFFIDYIKPDNKFFTGLPDSSWPLAAYHRIIVARLIPSEVKKLIYLDCDIMIKKDLSDLFFTDLEGKILGAVPDPAANNESRKRLGIPEEIDYFNSGVLLIDLDLWKKNKTEQKILDFMFKNKEKLKYPDNDALNAVLFNDWLRLPEKYNAFLYSKINDPSIIHFTSEKPWYYLSADQYQKEYLAYVSRTPWRDHWFRKLLAPSFAKKYHFLKIGLRIKTIVKQYKFALGYHNHTHRK